MLIAGAKEKKTKKKLYINSNLNTCMKDIVDMEKFTNLKICMLSFGIFLNRNNNYKCVRLVGIKFCVVICKFPPGKPFHYFSTRNLVRSMTVVIEK